MAGWLRKSEGAEGGREDEQMKRHRGAAISERGNSDRQKITASKRSCGNSHHFFSPSLSFSPPLLWPASISLATPSSTFYINFFFLFTSSS